MSATAQEIATKKVKVGKTINELALKNLGSVDISYAIENELEIIGTEEVIAKIQIDLIENQIAITGLTQKEDKTEQVKIFLRCSSIKMVSAASIGKLSISNIFDNAQGIVKANSIGSLNYDNNTEKAEIELESVGNLKMLGSSKNGYIRLSSIGNIKTNEFKFNDTVLTLTKSEK